MTEKSHIPFSPNSFSANVLNAINGTTYHLVIQVKTPGVILTPHFLSYLTSDHSAKLVGSNPESLAKVFYSSPLQRPPPPTLSSPASLNFSYGSRSDA